MHRSSAACLYVSVVLVVRCLAQDTIPTFGTTVVVPSGLRGLIYYIPPGSRRLPRFPELEAAGAIYTDSLNIPRRRFENGFPGVTDRFEWFAIDYTGRFWIEEPGDYRFAVTSDDGANVYIDGHLEIYNNGIHAPVRRPATVQLTGGIHELRVSYFQGPRFEVALILEVAGPHGQWHTFSTNEFKPPPNPDDWKFGKSGDAAGHMDVISATSLQAPKSAQKNFLKGLAALSDDDMAGAKKAFRHAVEQFPSYAQAWSSLGEMCDRDSEHDQARDAFEKALAADPQYVKPYVHLANLDIEEHRPEEAVDICNRAIGLGGAEFPYIHYYAAVASAELKHWDAAEKSARQATSLDDAHEVPHAEYLLGMILAARGDFHGAVEHLKKYLEISPTAQDADEVRRRIAELEQRKPE